MATVKNDYELIRKALDRPRRYDGVELELTVSFPSYPEKVEDEVAHVLGLLVGDAVEYSVITYPGNVSFQLFVQQKLADWIEDSWDDIHRVGATCKINGTWIFAMTQHFELQGTSANWVPSTHYGVILEKIDIATCEEKQF